MPILDFFVEPDSLSQHCPPLPRLCVNMTFDNPGGPVFPQLVDTNVSLLSFYYWLSAILHKS